MPRRFTLGDLVTRCQILCDQEDAGIASSTWKGWIGSVWAELYQIVASAGLRYWETSYEITTDGSASYAEPSIHLATVGVYWKVNADGQLRELVDLMAQEEHVLAGRTGQHALAYSLVDDRLYLYPTPPAGQTYVWKYIPQPNQLTTEDNDFVVDVVTPDGEIFVTQGVAALALAREESDSSVARAERDAARVRIMEWAAERNFNSPRRRIVADEYEDGPYWYDPADWRWR